LKILHDDRVRAELTPALALAAARTALIDAHRGLLATPPRLHAQLGGTELVFTAGGHVGGLIGFRVYGTWPGDSDQAVLVWEPEGRLIGCVVGTELGARRTGALGAAAADALARPDASVVGIIGSGRQAWTQLWALTAVRRITRVRVFSPNATHRTGFAQRASADLGLEAAPVADSREAVQGAEIVVLATRARQAVVAPEWIEPGTHLTTVGPKTRSAHETPPELVRAAAVVVSDSPAQASAYYEPFFTQRALVHLGAVVCGDAPGRKTDSDITVYCSTGLAGSEVLMAKALLDLSERAGPATSANPPRGLDS
jgi:alanine dehydrogenase